MSQLFKDAEKRLRTVRDVVRFAVSRFREHRLFHGHGTQDAWDEAVYLVLHTLHLPLDRLEPFLDARLTETELRATLDIVRRRIEERIPAAYLTGEAWLGDYRFEVDPRVIVPRSFIAELLFEQMQPWVADPEGVQRVLDLCTGSGCLAIIAADVFPNASVDAVDLSADALAVARRNVALHGLEARIRLIESDLFARLGKSRYDVILTNPPYVNAGSMAQLPPEYLHEPRLALAGGADGLDIVRRILAESKAHLKRAGLLIVEVGHERVHVEAAFPDLPCTWLTTSAGDDMVFMMQAAELQADQT